MYRLILILLNIWFICGSSMELMAELMADVMVLLINDQMASHAHCGIVIPQTVGGDGSGMVCKFMVGVPANCSLSMSSF